MKLSKGANISATSSPVKQQNQAAASAAATTEEAKQVSNTGKSPFRSSNAGGEQNMLSKNGSPKIDDDIEEDIIQDHEDI